MFARKFGRSVAKSRGAGHVQHTRKRVALQSLSLPLSTRRNVSTDSEPVETPSAVPEKGASRTALDKIIHDSIKVRLIWARTNKILLIQNSPGDWSYHRLTIHATLRQSSDRRLLHESEQPCLRKSWGLHHQPRNKSDIRRGAPPLQHCVRE